jgi:hypothetical protein
VANGDCASAGRRGPRRRGIPVLQELLAPHGQTEGWIAKLPWLVPIAALIGIAIALVIRRSDPRPYDQLAASGGGAGRLRPEEPKALQTAGLSRVAGAGFEPATFGL